MRVSNGIFYKTYRGMEKKYFFPFKCAVAEDLECDCPPTPTLQ